MDSQVLIATSSSGNNSYTIHIIPEQTAASADPDSVNRVTTESLLTCSTVDTSRSLKRRKRTPRKISRIVESPSKNTQVVDESVAARTEHPKKTKAGILCSYSECSCTDRTCVVYRTIKKPLIESWTKFIEENDPIPRFHKQVRLCRCHFRDLDDSTPKDQKLELLMNPEIVTSSDSSYHKNFQNKIIKTNERLAMIEESLLKMFNEDQVKKLIDEKPFVHYSEKTVEESYELYRACGVKGYQLLLKRGYPLPTIRTLQRMQRKMTMAEVVDDELQEQIYTIEAIIDDEHT